MMYHNNKEETSYSPPIGLTSMMLWPSEQSPIARSDNACMYSSSRHKVLQWLHVLVALIICVQVTFPVFANAITDLDISSPCTKTYISDTGQVCSFCSAGYYKTDDCVDSLEQARCRPCPPGTYQSMCNVATSCATCSAYCKNRHHVIERACTPTSDILCRCDDGFYWFYESSNPADGLCLKHSLCPRGTGLKAKGTYYNDTVCAPCRPGATFSSSESLAMCEPCTVCELYNATCTATSDSKCRAKLPEIPPETDGAHDSGEGMSTAILMVIILGSFVAFGFVVCVIIQFVRRRLCNSKPTSPPSTLPGADATAESIDTAPQAEASQEQTSVNDHALPYHYVTEEHPHASNATSRQVAECQTTSMQEDIDETDASPTGPTLVLDDEEGDRSYEMSRAETPTGTFPIDREDSELYSAHMVEGCYRQQNHPTHFDSALHNTIETTEPEGNVDPNQSYPPLLRDGISVGGIRATNVPNETHIKTRYNDHPSGSPVLIQQNHRTHFDAMSYASALHNTMGTTEPEGNVDPHQSYPPSLRDGSSAGGIRVTNLPDETHNKTRYNDRPLGANGRGTDRRESVSTRTDATSFDYSNNPEVQRISDDVRITETHELRKRLFMLLAKMSKDEFNQFYRTIAMHEDVDGWIEDARHEHGTSCKEAQYQLMRKLYNVFPNTSHPMIIQALHDVDLNLIAKNYQELLDQNKLVYV